MNSSEEALRFLIPPYKNGMGKTQFGVTQILPKYLQASSFPIVGYSVLGTCGPQDWNSRSLEIALYTDCSPDPITGKVDERVFHDVQKKLENAAGQEIEYNCPISEAASRGFVGNKPTYEEMLTSHFPGKIILPIQTERTDMVFDTRAAWGSAEGVESEHFNAIKRSKILDVETLEMLGNDVKGIIMVLAKQKPSLPLTSPAGSLGEWTGRLASGTDQPPTIGMV